LLQEPYFVEGSNVLTDVSGGRVRMWARLAPGVTARMAEQELLTLTNQLRKQYPKLIWDKEFIHSDPGGHSIVMQKEMYQVAAMVGVLVLLILAVACANLGGLMVARGVTREREMSIRTAIGASHMRIFRQLFTESVLLALLGSVAGLVLSWVVLRVTLALVMTDGPGWMSTRPDWRVLLFAVGMALIAAVFFGFAPALQTARQQQRRSVARQVLVGAQVAASCVLLIVAGLLVRAVHHMLYTDPGFGYEQVVAISPGLDNHGYTPDAARAYLDELKSRLRAYPGVTSVALSKIPMLGNGLTTYMSVDIKGHPVSIYPNWIDPEFFPTMSIPLVRGRNVLPDEANAVIVSESLARLQWPGQDPLGERLWPDGNNLDTVVGVAGNARVKALNDDDAVEAYWAAQSADMAQMTLVVKTSGAPDGLVPAVKDIAESLDPRLFPYIWLLRSGFHQSARQVE
jgi:predicted permease